MIKIELANDPGYPTTRPEYYGTIHHSEHGVAASVNYDYKSTRGARRYLCGLAPPNYPVPSTLGICEAFPDVGHCLCLYAADQDRPNPLVTWYDFEFAKNNGLGIPKDHGLVEDWN